MCDTRQQPLLSSAALQTTPLLITPPTSIHVPYNEIAIWDVTRAPPSGIADVITSTALFLLQFPRFLKGAQYNTQQIPYTSTYTSVSE